MNQMLLILVHAYTQVLIKLHLNKYLPHEAQNQEHAKNYQIVKACKLK